jgi:molybdopterin synthase catalytic subunit
MDITEALSRLKKEPGFQDQVGMVLIHNGVVRGHSRGSKDAVHSLKVTPDQERIEALRQEYESRPGIFRIIVQANQGEFQPGQ